MLQSDLHARVQALDSGNVQGAATQYQQKCSIGWRLFLGRYAQWAQAAALPDSDLEQINTEMARWAASSAPQQLNFSQAEEGAISARHSPASLADPSPAAPLPACPDSSSSPWPAASAGAQVCSEAAALPEDEEDSIVADVEEDNEEVRHERCNVPAALCACTPVESAQYILESCEREHQATMR